MHHTDGERVGETERVAEGEDELSGPEATGLPPSFIRLDPPEHDRLRRMANSSFGPPHRPHRIDAVRGELVLAIYEVGQCFFRGWGVKKDAAMALVRRPA